VKLLQFSTDKQGVRPLKPLQQDQTLTRYATTFRALLVFLLNSHRYQGLEDEALGGLYECTEGLAELLTKLRSILTTLVRKQSEPPVLGSQGLTVESPIEVDSEDDELDALDTIGPSSSDDWLDTLNFERRALDQAKNLLSDLFLGLARQSTATGPNKSPLYMFTACLSIDYRKRAFKSVNLIGQSYSALIRGYQFIVLLDAHKHATPDVS
jgi:hypothetical protein